MIDIVSPTPQDKKWESRLQEIKGQHESEKNQVTLTHSHTYKLTHSLYHLHSLTQSPTLSLNHLHSLISYTH